MFTFFCELLDRAVEAWNKKQPKPKDINMKISKYMEDYGSEKEKIEYRDLGKWLGVVFKQKNLSKEIMNTGLEFSNGGDRRQMRITNSFISGDRLFENFRNNTVLLSCWPLHEKPISSTSDTNTVTVTTPTTATATATATSTTANATITTTRSNSMKPYHECSATYQKKIVKKTKTQKL